MEKIVYGRVLLTESTMKALKKRAKNEYATVCIDEAIMHYLKCNNQDKHLTLPEIKELLGKQWEYLSKELDELSFNDMKTIIAYSSGLYMAHEMGRRS